MDSSFNIERDAEIEHAIESFKAAAAKLQGFRDATVQVAKGERSSGPGCVEKEWNAANKAVRIAIRSSGPFLV